MKENPSFSDLFSVVCLFVVLVVLFVNVIPDISKRVGTTHSGIVVQEICNAHSDSYVTVDYGNLTSKTVSYRTSLYTTCLDFLYHHGLKVTITDDAWGPYIASYRWD